MASSSKQNLPMEFLRGGNAVSAVSLLFVQWRWTDMHQPQVWLSWYKEVKINLLNVYFVIL